MKWPKLLPLHLTEICFELIFQSYLLQFRSCFFVGFTLYPVNVFLHMDMYESFSMCILKVNEILEINWIMSYIEESVI